MRGKALLTHADDGSLIVEHDAVALHVRGALLHDLSQALIEGVREADVADDATLEEGEGADALGAVDDLVRDDEVHGLDLLLQGADGGEGDDAADADGAQGGDVGAGGHLVRRELVVQAVAGEEGDGHAGVLEDHDRGGRLAPGRRRVQGGDGRVTLQLAEAGAADDGDVDGAWCEAMLALCSQSRARAFAGGSLREGRKACRGACLRSKVVGRSAIVSMVLVFAGKGVSRF